jgi:hypothetical protein
MLSCDQQQERTMLGQRFAVGALAAIVISLSATIGEAEELHAITCIKNKTDALISFEIKYGSKGFSPKFLAAGYETSFYQLARDAEPMMIRYDADLNPGAAHRVTQTYVLKARNASGKSCALGHIYEFEIDKATTLLRLYDGR